MRRAACGRGSFPRDTSAKPGTSRIQSRALQAIANSHRRQSFQNSADSTATSSLHPAFFTLSLRFTILAVSENWVLRLAHGMEGPHTRKAWPPSIDTSLPDFVLPPQPFCHWMLTGSEQLSASLNGVCRLWPGYQLRALRISSADKESKSQMRAIQSKCSGFMSTDRRQVSVSRSRFMAPRFASQK